MKIKANTIKRARRLQRALERDEVSSNELVAKARRLETKPCRQDPQYVHATILRAIECGFDRVSVNVARPNAQIALWRARGFRVCLHSHWNDEITLEGWADQ